jgi:hypothetical protein
MGEYSMLTMNYPNFFTFAPEDKDIGTLGILLCMGIFFLVFYTLAARKAELTRELLIKAAIFSVLNATYFLPHMHERYSLIAEVLMLGWLCYDFKKLYLVVITYAATMLTYIKYIFNAGELALPEELLSVVRLMVLAAVTYDLLSPRDRRKQQAALTETE